MSVAGESTNHLHVACERDPGWLGLDGWDMRILLPEGTGITHLFFGGFV